MSRQKEYLDLLTEEYRALTTRSDWVDRHTYTVLQWGTALVAVIASAAMSQWGKHDSAVEISFLLAIPCLIAVGMLYWIGELARLKRIASFICVLEAKIELALRHRAGSSGKSWISSFEQAWTDNWQSVLSNLPLGPPFNGRGQVDLGPGPIEFERWLHRLRDSRANNNFTWVYMVRLAPFPAGIAASWSLGIYYVLSQSAKHGFGGGDIIAALFGLLFGILAIWLTVEVAADLNSSGHAPLQLPWLRRVFRDMISRPLQMTEWKIVEPGTLDAELLDSSREET